MQKILLLVAVLCFSLLCKAQNNNIRGMYVADIPIWLGDTAQENTILRYAQANNLNYITIYSLQDFNWTSSTKKNLLGKFIRKAKTTYGIIQVGASSEKSSFFLNDLIPYNNGRTDTTDRFNVFNFEFEFWL